MRLSDFIVIYFAVGAPVFVSRFTNLSRSRTQTSLSVSVVYGLIWPLVFTLTFVRSLANQLRTIAVNKHRGFYHDSEVALQTVACLSALAKLYDPADSKSEFADESRELELRIVRSAVEKYVELSLAVRPASLSESPAQQELEFCRIAGRMGSDQMLGATCIHRRNVTRLVSRQAQSKAELIGCMQQLTGGLEIERNLDCTNKDTKNSDGLALLRFSREVIDLASLLDDAATAAKVTEEIQKLNPPASQSFKGLADSVMVEGIKTSCLHLSPTKDLHQLPRQQTLVNRH